MKPNQPCYALSGDLAIYLVRACEAILSTTSQRCDINRLLVLIPLFDVATSSELSRRRNRATPSELDLDHLSRSYVFIAL
jgi:hypothetical protein